MSIGPKLNERETCFVTILNGSDSMPGHTHVGAVSILEIVHISLALNGTLSLRVGFKPGVKFTKTQTKVKQQDEVNENETKS